MPYQAYHPARDCTRIRASLSSRHGWAKGARLRRLLTEDCLIHRPGGGATIGYDHGGLPARPAGRWATPKPSGVPRDGALALGDKHLLQPDSSWPDTPLSREVRHRQESLKRRGSGVYSLPRERSKGNLG
jgi:hypothetical protein